MKFSLHPLRTLCATAWLIAHCSQASAACANAASSQRFVLGKSGTAVGDCHTGLIWFRCVVGQEWNAGANTCSGIPYRAPRLQVLAYAGEVRHNGYRLPTTQQLSQLLAANLENPQSYAAAFPDTPPGSFWIWEGYSAWSSKDVVPPGLVDFSGGTAKENRMPPGTGFYLRYVLIPGSPEAVAAGFPLPTANSK